MMLYIIWILLFVLRDTSPSAESGLPESGPPEGEAQVIHVYVALCDNKYQGIVPVPAKIGNGQDPHTNLYWGCGYGVRTYFGKSPDWKLVRKLKKDSLILEQLVFKHNRKDWYLVAEAYNGKYIQECTRRFLNSAAGLRRDTVRLGERVLGTAGGAKALAYIGHDGLMEFELREYFGNTDGKTRDVIVLACVSKHFFKPHLEDAKVNPLVWTTGLMCPEAYTLHDALDAYLGGGNNEAVRSAAARAYAKYQKCGENAARKLLVTGW